MNSNSNLKEKATAAVFWSFADRFGQQGIQFLVSVVLARLLAPSEIGIIGMLSIFMALGQTLLDSGFGQALIQRKLTNRLEESSVFFLNILIAITGMLVLWVCAPFISGFYKAPILIPITHALSFNFVLSAFGLVPSSLMTKNLDFKSQAHISMISAAISGIVGVSMAYAGYGVWSLVGQSLTMNGVRSLFLWILGSWRPMLAFSLKSLADMFGFGSKLVLSGIIDTIFRNLYEPTIGRLFSATTLGYFSMANRICGLPTESLTTIVSRVTFPLFSTIGEDSSRLKRGMNKSLTLMMLFHLPFLTGLALISENLVHVLLTDKWLPIVPYLQLLCCVAVLAPVHQVNINALLALGRSDIFFRLEIVKKMLQVSLLAASLHWGVTGLILGQLIHSLLCAWLNSRHVGRHAGYSLGQQVRDVLPYAGFSAVMAIAVFSIHVLPLNSSLIMLSLQILTGVIVYGLLLFKFRRNDLQDIYQIFCSPAQAHV